MKALSKALSEIPVSAPTAVDALVRERRAAGEEIISFCVGEPDFETPPDIALAGIEAIRAGKTKYTNPSGIPELRRAAAEQLFSRDGLSYESSQVVVTTGAKYAVFAAVMAICDPGDEVIVPSPMWPSYRPILRLCGVALREVVCSAETGYKLTPAALAGACTEKTKAMILNNPNNPTGMLYSPAELAALAAVCREKDIYVISDEIYGRLAYDGRVFLPMAAAGEEMAERTVTITGVSKSYAMTGWRIGFAAASKEIARRISILVNHTTGSPCSVSQEAALAALLGTDAETETMRSVYEARRNTIVPALRKVPFVSFTVPEGAFYILLDVREAIRRSDSLKDDFTFAMELLREERVALVPCADYGAPGHLRISYTLEEPEALEGIARLAAFVERRCRA